MSFLDKISEYFSSHDNLINASTGKLQFVTSSGGSSNLSDLSDVDTTNLADDSIMQYNSTSGKFEFTNELDGGTV